jgi:nucleotide-binding universal stress UspA family protein
MSQFEKIIVGHDLRTGGEMATRAAAMLAKRCGAALKLVYALEPYSVYQRLSHPFTASYSDEELAQRAGEKLEALATAAEYGLPRVEYEVRTGKPFVELILASRAWQADLIVVGGIAQGEERFLGSTNERVVRKAMVPVLVAKKPFKDHVQTFLVPTDFSGAAKQAALKALNLAETFGGRVVFFHVMDLSALYSFGAGPDVLGAVPPPVPLLTPEDIEGEWDAFLAELPQLSKISWKKYTVEGKAAAGIVQQAEESRADLIVMGTHGRSGLAHMLLGSVAERVMHSSACSVMTVRPEAFQFELP